MKIKASQVKIGDKIILDFGFFPQTDERPAEVMQITKCKKLFGEGEDINFAVRSFGDNMNSGFDPEDFVTLA